MDSGASGSSTVDHSTLTLYSGVCTRHTRARRDATPEPRHASDAISALSVPVESDDGHRVGSHEDLEVGAAPVETLDRHAAAYVYL